MADDNANTPPPAQTPEAAKGPEAPVDRATDHQPTPPVTQTPQQTNPSRDDAILTALAALPEKLTDAFKTLSQPAPPPPTEEVKETKVEQTEEPKKRRSFADIWFGNGA